MHYTVIKKIQLTALIVEVQSFLREGWICLGGVCVDSSGSDTFYYQSMTKE